MLVWGEEDHLEKVPLSSHRIKGTSTGVTITVDIHLDHLAEAVFARFLSCKVTLLPPFYAFHFGYQSLCMAHVEGAGSYAAPPPRQSVYTNYLNSSSWEMCLFSSIYLLIQSFVHSGVDSLRVFVNITPIERHGF